MNKLCSTVAYFNNDADKNRKKGIILIKLVILT